MKTVGKLSALALAAAILLSLTACDGLSSVTNNVSAASDVATEMDALEADNAYKTYYSGIASGAINNENKPSSLSDFTLPGQSASGGERKNYAKTKATLKEAMLYSGIWDKLEENVTSGCFGYADGDIVRALDDSGNIISNTDGGAVITQIKNGYVNLGTIESSGS